MSVPLQIKNLIAKLRSETTIMTPQTLKLVVKQGRSCVDDKNYFTYTVYSITYRPVFSLCIPSSSCPTVEEVQQWELQSDTGMESAVTGEPYC